MTRDDMVRMFGEALTAKLDASTPETLPVLLFDEIVRLRALVESTGCVDGVCLWCGVLRPAPHIRFLAGYHQPHGSDCDAFTPDGTVK